MMKPFRILMLLTIVVVFAACDRETRELKKEVNRIADAMCRNIDVMHRLQAVTPDDTTGQVALQQELEKIQQELETLNSGFREKYSAKINDQAFRDHFNKLLREAMLECKSLSKEDRENFEREVE
jgi:hypothetical protein